MEHQFVQKFKRSLSPKERVGRYYKLLLALNDIKLSPQQIDLLVFTACLPFLSADKRKEFAQKTGSAMGAVDNAMGALKKKGLIVEEDGKLVVNPYARPPFGNNIRIEIELNGEAIHQINKGLSGEDSGRGDGDGGGSGG